MRLHNLKVVLFLMAPSRPESGALPLPPAGEGFPPQRRADTCRVTLYHYPCNKFISMCGKLLA